MKITPTPSLTVPPETKGWGAYPLHFACINCNYSSRRITCRPPIIYGSTTRTRNNEKRTHKPTTRSLLYESSTNSWPVLDQPRSITIHHDPSRSILDPIKSCPNLPNQPSEHQPRLDSRANLFLHTHQSLLGADPSERPVTFSHL